MTVVVDLDGVVYLGEDLIPGSDDGLRALLANSIHVLFATNNSTRTPEQTVSKLRRITGLSFGSESVVTSGQAAASTMSSDDDPCLVLGSEAIGEAMTDVGLSLTDDPGLARSVVVGMDLKLSYDRLARASTAVRSGARLVATNDDATYPTENGLLPGSGSIVAALEKASGVSAAVAGKPHAPMRDLIRSKSTLPIWIVGDRLDTDIAMAEAEAPWKSLLVLSGVTDPGVAPSTQLTAPNLLSAAELILNS